MSVPTAYDEPRQSLVRGVLARRQALLARIVTRARAEFSGYTRFDAEVLARGAGPVLDLVLGALSEARTPTAAELVTYREYGRGRADMAIPLPEVLGVWRMSAREILHDLATVARAEGGDDRLLLTLTHDLLDIFDVAIRVYTAGHQEIELARAGREHERRSDVMRAMLLGTLSEAEIRVEATRYGLDPDGEYLAFRADGGQSGVVPPGWRSPDGTAAVGCGAPGPLAGLPSSYEQATRAWETAVALGLDGVHSLESLGILPAVVAEPDLGDRLVHRYLDPLGEGASGTMLRETLEGHLAAGLRVEQTATALFLHQNTVRYRLARFAELTGTDLRDQRQVFELWWALQRVKVRTLAGRQDPP